MTEFFVAGIPKPGGSKRGFRHPKTGKQMIVDTCNNKDWRSSVAFTAHAAKDHDLYRGVPLKLTITFHMPRPKHHYNSKGILKQNAPKYHTTKPDGTKLTRCLEDALTGVIWQDDSIIVKQDITKLYANELPGPGAYVRVEELDV